MVLSVSRSEGDCAAPMCLLLVGLLIFLAYLLENLLKESQSGKFSSVNWGAGMAQW